MELSNASIAETVSFPLEEQLFVELQTDLNGRQLSERECEITIDYMQIINCYYEDGKDGEEYEPLYEDAESWFRERGKMKNFTLMQEFYKSVDWWCQLAFKRGREYAGLKTE